jgi:hypothetical protein
MMKDDAWIVQQFLNERSAREISGHGAALGAFERIRDRLAAAERGQKEAIAQMCKTARELGEAQGKLTASELPGIIDGWRERALDAERERDEARKEAEQHFGAAKDNRAAWNEVCELAITYRKALEKAREGLAKIENGDEVRRAGHTEIVDCSDAAEISRATIAAIDAALNGE